MLKTSKLLRQCSSRRKGRIANLSTFAFCLLFVLHSMGHLFSGTEISPISRMPLFPMQIFVVYLLKTLLMFRVFWVLCFACGMSVLASLVMVGKEHRLQRSHRGVGLLGWMWPNKPCSQSVPCIFEAEVMNIDLLCVFWKWLLQDSQFITALAGHEHRLGVLLLLHSMKLELLQDEPRFCKPL